MPRKKAAEAEIVETLRPGQHSAVQVQRSDADVYYIDEAARERYESKK